MSTKLVINIRGGTAYGKTTLARAFLKHKTSARMITSGDQTTVLNVCDVPELELPVYVLGPYDDSKYSGCDKIKSADAIVEFVEIVSGNDYRAHLIFEGFRVSKSWERHALLKHRLDKARQARMMFLFLDMGLDVKTVVERASARRNEGAREVDPAELKHVVTQMDNSCRKSRQVFPKDTILIDAHLPADEVAARAVAAMKAKEAEPWPPI